MELEHVAKAYHGLQPEDNPDFGTTATTQAGRCLGGDVSPTLSSTWKIGAGEVCAGASGDLSPET